MAVLMAVGELGFDATGSALNMTAEDPRRQVDVGGIDTTYSRKALDLQGGSGLLGYVDFLNPLPTGDGVGEFWFHFRATMDWTVSLTNDWFIWVDENDKPVFGLRIRNGWYNEDDWWFYSYDDDGNASVLNRKVTSQAISGNFDVVWDMERNEIRAYQDNSLFFDGALDCNGRSSGTNIARLKLVKDPYDNDIQFSEVIAADESTIGWRGLTTVADGLGTYTDFSGTADTVNKVSLDPAVYAEATAAGKQTYTVTSIPEAVKADMRVEAVVVQTVGNATGSLTTLTNLVRVNGVDFNLSNKNVNLTNFAVPVIDYVRLNPNTNRPWTWDDIDNMEVGFEGS